MNWNLSRGLALIAVIVFVLAFFGLGGTFDLLALGLAFFAASFVVP
jgi:hypothetical protein